VIKRDFPRPARRTRRNFQPRRDSGQWRHLTTAVSSATFGYRPPSRARGLVIKRHFRRPARGCAKFSWRRRGPAPPGPRPQSSRQEPPPRNPINNDPRPTSTRSEATPVPGRQVGLRAVSAHVRPSVPAGCFARGVQIMPAGCTGRRALGWSRGRESQTFRPRTRDEGPRSRP
jgi:hypothetical protein